MLIQFILLRFLQFHLHVFVWTEFCVVLWLVCSCDYYHSHSLKIYRTINTRVLLFPHLSLPSPSLTMLSLWQPLTTLGFYSSATPRMLINRSYCTDACRLGSFWVYSLEIHWLLCISKVCSFIILDRIVWCLCCP